MMQPTHLKFGVAWGLLAIPVAVYTGLIPSLQEGFRAEDLIFIIIGLYACIKGALFGSEFPDTDHPTSIPSRKHPILSKMFEVGRSITGETEGKTSKLKKKWFAHRGIMSHDYLMHVLYWGVLLYIVNIVSQKVMVSISEGVGVGIIVYLLVLFIIWTFANDLTHLSRFLLSKAGFKIDKGKQSLYHIGVFVGSVLIVIIFLSKNFGGSFGDILTGDLGLATTSLLAMWFFYGLKVFIIFTFIGCVSHLFGDMITVSGVYFGTIQIKPMSVFYILTKIPFLNLAFDGFRTGGRWEKINSTIISIVIIPATVLAILSVLGWDMSKLVELPEFISKFKS